jgi:hypothetical protein
VVLYPANSLSNNAELGTVTLPRLMAQEIHAACITTNSNVVRVRCDFHGLILIETTAPAKQWIAVSLVGLLV